MAGFGPMGALSPEEEEEMLRAAAAKQGMISQSALSPEVLALANKEYGGQQRAIDTQKALAAKMMGAKGKQGHMMGNVYAGPTWADSLANVGEKLVGGYQMKKAREADATLEEERASALESKGALTEAVKQEEREYQAGVLTSQNEVERLRTGESVDLVNADGDTKQAVEIEGQLFEQDRVTPVGEGWITKPKITRGSGSQYSVTKGKDKHGNDVWFTFDKSTGANSPSQFIDGSEYNAQDAAVRGQCIADQAAAEATATGVADADVDQVVYSAELQQTYGDLTSKYDRALELLDEGAETGPISQYTPTFRGTTKELETLRDETALDLLSENTFGSLSTAEGNWLKGVAIPTGLDGPELKTWLTTKRNESSSRAKVEAYKEKQARAGKPADQKHIQKLMGRDDKGDDDAAAKRQARIAELQAKKEEEDEENAP